MESMYLIDELLDQSVILLLLSGVVAFPGAVAFSGAVALPGTTIPLIQSCLYNGKTLKETRKEGR